MFEFEGHLVETGGLDGEELPVGYKVVTEDLKSLGLRNNPNILTYEIGEWVCLSEEETEEGKGDWGGIWCARNETRAKSLKNYISSYHNTKTRIFKSFLGEILFINSYRIKTDKIMLFEEIFP